MFEIIDDFSWTKERQIITKDKHLVPGLCNFSHFTYTHSIQPAPMHYHSNIVEIFCMIKGNLHNEIEKNGDLTEYDTVGNQAFICYPFELHSNGNEPLTPLEFYAIQIDVSNPNRLFGFNAEYSNSLYKQLIALEHHQVSLGAVSLNNLRSAFNFFGEMNPDSIRIGVQFLTCFLFNLKFLTAIPESKISSIDPQIKASIDYCLKNITQELQVNDLAEASSYSLSRFNVKFKEEVGMPPAEYINMQKIELAKKKLIETNSSITTISYSLGFSSSSYFCSVFKKLAACTPQYYRRNNSRN